MLSGAWEVLFHRVKLDQRTMEAVCTLVNNTQPTVGYSITAHTSSTNSKIIVNIYMSCSLLLLSDKLPLSPHTKTVEYTVVFCKQTHRQCCRWRHCFCSSVVSGRKRKQFVFQFFNMVVATMPKRVRAARPDFVSLSASTESLKQRKRVNKNKKKNWNKHSDINDIEKYLDDVRHEQRTTG